MIASEHPEGPEKDPEDSLGLTVTNYDYMMYGDLDPNASWRVFVFVNLSRLELLMRDDLNTAERMTIQWEVANTVSTAQRMPHLGA